MRLPSLSSLLCLAGLASVPVNGYAGNDPNIKSIPVSAVCSMRMRYRGTDLSMCNSCEPTVFRRYEILPAS